MAIRPNSKQIAIGLVALASLGLGTAWADDDYGDDDRRLIVGPLVQVSGASPFGDLGNCGNFPQGGVNFVGSEVEPWLDVNPVDPDNIAAFWQQDRWSNGGARSNVAGVSLDGGLSWQTVVVPGLTDCSGGVFERASDPWISFAPDGTLHQMSLLISGPTFGGRSAMGVSRSADGGLTWSAPILVIDDNVPGVLNDKNSITADATDANVVYAVWDRLQLFATGGFEGPVYLARTTDGGMTWEPAREIFNPGFVNQTLGNQIVVLPDGTVLDFFNKIVNVNPDGTVNPQPLAFRLTFIRSDDQGVTWDTSGGGTEIAIILGLGVVTPDLGVGVRDGSILFDVAVDRKKGTLYAVWQDFRFTGFDQIAFSTSRDGGATWTNPIRVNQTPANPARPFTQQAFLPSVAVDDKGTVVVTYYDFRNDDATGELADHWMIFCKKKCDRSDSWKHETRLTDDSFDYLQAPVANGLFLGDYMGLAAIDTEALAFFQQSSAADPADGFFRKVIRDGDDDDDDDNDDDDNDDDGHLAMSDDD